MTSDEFQRRTNRMVTDLAAVHAQALSLSDDVGVTTTDALEIAAGAIGAAMFVLETAAERCPVGGTAP